MRSTAQFLTTLSGPSPTPRPCQAAPRAWRLSRPALATMSAMRKLATVRSGWIRRVILLEEDDGSTFLFLIDQDADVGCCADEWFETMELAEDYALGLGVRPEDWRSIDDAPPGCQDDFIAPVRAVGRDSSGPQGVRRLERQLENGQWAPFDPPGPLFGPKRDRRRLPEGSP